jgi:tetratricopeptide (TPR) repeat protein
MRVYSETGRMEAARHLFETRVGFDKGSMLCNEMMVLSIKAGDLASAGHVFEFAVESGRASPPTYAILAAANYNAGQYIAAGRVLEKAPPELRESPAFLLRLAECKRKSGEAREALRLANKVTASFPGNYSSDDYVHARLVLAFCMKDRGMRGQARRDFLSLKRNVPISSPHYPRILCGIVFSSDHLTRRQREEIGKALEFFKGSRNGPILRDIRNALKILREDPSGTTRRKPKANAFISLAANSR